MKIKGRIFIAFLAATMAFAGIVNNAIAEAEYTSQEWAHMINLAGKQRMLTQKMTKEMLLVAAGVDVDANRLNLKKTADLFDKTLKGLLNGDADLNLKRAKSTISQKTLEQVADIWVKYKEIVDGVVGGGDAPLEEVTDPKAGNIPLLKRMNVGVRLFEKEAQKEVGGESSAVINYAGRQRMLTQKMSKEMLLVFLNHDKDKNLANLQKTVGMFDVTLKSLRNGGDIPYGKNRAVKVHATSDAGIKAQLDVVKGLWDKFKPLTADINEESINKMAGMNLPLLKEMNKAVKMYEKAQN